VLLPILCPNGSIQLQKFSRVEAELITSIVLDNDQSVLSILDDCAKDLGIRKADAALRHVQDFEYVREKMQYLIGPDERSKGYISLIPGAVYTVKTSTEHARRIKTAMAISIALAAVALFAVSTLVAIYVNQPVPLESIEIEDDNSEIPVGKYYDIPFSIQPLGADTTGIRCTASPSANVLECITTPSSIRILLDPSFNEPELRITCYAGNVKDEAIIPVRNDLDINLYSNKTVVSPGFEFKMQASVDCDIDIAIDWEYDHKQITTSKELGTQLTATVNWNIDKDEIPVTATISGTPIKTTAYIRVDALPSIKGNVPSATIDAGGSDILSVEVSPSAYPYDNVEWTSDSEWVSINTGKGKEVTVNVAQTATSGDCAIITANASGLIQIFKVTVGKDMGARIETVGNCNNLGPGSEFTVSFTTDSKFIDLSNLRIESEPEGQLVTVTQKGTTATVTVLDFVSKGEFKILAKLGDRIIAEKIFEVSTPTAIAFSPISDIYNGDTFTLTASLNVEGYSNRIVWEIEDDTASVILLNSMGPTVTGKVSLTAEGTQTFTLRATVSDTDVSQSVTLEIKSRALSISDASSETIAPNSSFTVYAYGYEDQEDVSYEWSVESTDAVKESISSDNVCIIDVLATAELNDCITVRVRISGTGIYAEKIFNVNFDPYSGYGKIFGVEDLLKIGDNLSGSYILMNDINMGGSYWSPIGYDEASRSYSAFTGTFLGSDHWISNFHLTQPSKDKDGNSYTGFFSIIGAGGSVSGLRLSGNADIISLTKDFKDTVFAGMLAGQNSGDVNGICVSGTITYNNSKVKTAEAINLGGVVGLSYGSVSNSHSNVSISAYASATVVGGVVGGVMSGSVSRCVFDGGVFGYAIDDYSHIAFVGGIVGYSGFAYSVFDGWFFGAGTHNTNYKVASDISISKCVCSGNVVASGDYNWMASYHSGGIIGDLDGKFDITVISECTYNGGGALVGNR